MRTTKEGRELLRELYLEAMEVKETLLCSVTAHELASLVEDAERLAVIETAICAIVEEMRDTHTKINLSSSIVSDVAACGFKLQDWIRRLGGKVDDLHPPMMPDGTPGVRDNPCDMYQPGTPDECVCLDKQVAKANQ